jgi:hypothetical protein
VTDFKLDHAQNTYWVMNTFVGGFEPENGQVHLIQLADNSADILCEGLYTHQNEIWDLAACPFDSQFFSTVYASGIITKVSSPLNLSLGR